VASGASVESSPALLGVGVGVAVGVGMSTFVALPGVWDDVNDSVPELTAIAAPAVPSTAMTVRIVIAGVFMIQR